MVLLGFGDVRIFVLMLDDVEAFVDRLAFHGVARRDDGRALRFDDPWGTRLVVSPGEGSGTR